MEPRASRLALEHKAGASRTGELRPPSPSSATTPAWVLLSRGIEMAKTENRNPRNYGLLREDRECVEGGGAFSWSILVAGVRLAGMLALDELDGLTLRRVLVERSAWRRSNSVIASMNGSKKSFPFVAYLVYMTSGCTEEVRPLSLTCNSRSNFAQPQFVRDFVALLVPPLRFPLEAKFSKRE